jgi:aryl-alcohol dehydrogenase-like predicted oxidoreductase
MKALNDLVQSGKIHYVGVSNVTGWQFQRIIDLCREKGYNQIVSNQVSETQNLCTVQYSCNEPYLFYNRTILFVY